jgi:hypothetical protein
VEAAHPKKDDSIGQAHGHHPILYCARYKAVLHQACADQFDVKNKSVERERVCYEAHIARDANVFLDNDSDGDTYWGGSKSDDETVAAHNTERRRANEENLSDIMQITPGFKTRLAAIIDEDLE